VVRRKRRPGGGRKPIGEFPKSAAFTTRLEPATRRALDEAAQTSGDSVSEVAGRLLKAALKKPTGAPRNQALAAMVAELAEIVERDTGKSWQDDPWTGEALRYLIDAALFHFSPTPEDLPAVPTAIEQAAAKMPSEFAEWYRKPKGYGLTKAQFVIAEIEHAAAPGANEWTLPIFFNDRPSRLGIIGRDLGLAQRTKGKSR
jgi:hypothetical protein